jgi:peptide/nickel transport system permease protein
VSSVLAAQPVRARVARMRRLGGLVVVASAAILALFVTMALSARWLAPNDPNAVDFSNTLAPPSGAHWLGTDFAGRDTLSRLIYGAQTSLVGPLAVVVLSTSFGAAIGLYAAWRGGWVETGINRVLDIVFAFPALLLAILVVAIYGKGLLAPVIAMSIAYMPYTARLVRSLVLAEKARPYVAAYRVQGFSGPYIAGRRILANVSPTVLAQSTVNFGYALLDLAALSFLGLGVQQPTADWGSMVDQGRGAVLQGQPLSAVAPAVAVVLVVVAFNLVGEETGDRIGGRND